MSSGKIILALQIGGFILAVLALAIHAPHLIFVAAFAVHLTGDLMLVEKEGLPKMPFNIGNYLKLAPWLQFIGLMLAFGGLLSLRHWLGVPLAYIGLGVSLAGFVYEKIYP